MEMMMKMKKMKMMKRMKKTNSDKICPVIELQILIATDKSKRSYPIIEFS